MIDFPTDKVCAEYTLKGTACGVFDRAFLPPRLDKLLLNKLPDRQRIEPDVVPPSNHPAPNIAGKRGRGEGESGGDATGW